jgi:hypothetical protein
MSDVRSRAAWSAGVQAYDRGDPPSQHEGPDWHGGYEWAKRTARRDLAAWGLAIMIATALASAGVIAIGLAWWMS